MSEREELENILAIFFAHNRQPHMSGDPRARLSPLQRRDMEDAITEILAAGWSRAIPAPVALREAAAEIAALRAVIAEAKEALEPFAEWGEMWDDGRPGEHRVDARNLASDLRRARAALARIEGMTP